MIQFNLLPDVKLQYIKAEQTRRLVIAISTILSIASVVILFLLISVNAFQSRHLDNLKKDIVSNSSKIQKQPDLNSILTLQNQLKSLTALHAGKPAASRLATYLNQITPPGAFISDITVNFTTQSITVVGTADSLATVNTFVNTLKAKTYTTADMTTPKAAFAGVVLSAFGITPKESSYTINFTYDPPLFDIAQKNVSLTLTHDPAATQPATTVNGILGIPNGSTITPTGKAR